MQMSKYESILEYVPNNEDKLNINIKSSNLLYVCMKNFIHNISLKETDTIMVSLSGGVDSMVLLDILKELKNNDEFTQPIVCAHICYNNRDESKEEMEFLKSYCYHQNIGFEFLGISFTRDETKRSIYEQKTRFLRYNFYETLIEKYNGSGIFLAHHEGDLCENIFNNIMRGGHEISDLCVLKESNTILNVNILRPFLPYKKETIYDYAHSHQIPYFKDSTPDWSCRGKMRRQIFPKCEDCYGVNFYNNLLKIGNEAENMGSIIEKYIIDDLFSRVIKESNEIKIPICEKIQDFYILKLFLKKICIQLQIDHIKHKHLQTIIRMLTENRENVKLSLGKKYTLNFKKEYMIIEKIEN